ncbi:MAG: hypothetical protein V7K69_05820 [Nostoc sp.]|uniref:hypothetical protein n=1 Tax=Nostoc sp. TaxID=1180 RepID=UPI002FFA0B35
MPNPPVGYVILDTQHVLAQGYTQVPGKHHTEADVLKQIQGKAFKFLKMYVTLEPCSFHRRTPEYALAIACGTVLPITILGASVTTVTTFIPKNVSKNN